MSNAFSAQPKPLEHNDVFYVGTLPQDCCAIPKELLNEYSYSTINFRPPRMSGEIIEWFAEMGYEFRTRWFWKAFDEGNDGYQKYRVSIKNEGVMTRPCIPILMFHRDSKSSMVMFRMRWIT